MNEPATYLTQTGLDKLHAELDELVSERRPAVLARIKDAVSHGDLSENSEYEEAKNEQGFIEGRIAELQKLLQNATVVEAVSNGTVALGSVVTAEQNGQATTLTVVGPAEADPSAGMVSNESPIGAALIGKSVGDSITVATPKGDATYKITHIK